MKNGGLSELLTYLRANGPTPSKQLVEQFGISRATLSRRINSLGDAIVTIGKGRATQLAARHADTTGSIPLYYVSRQGQTERAGELTALQDGSNTQWFLDYEPFMKPLCRGGFESGLFPGWPWFLEDLRPSGFLGRAFGKRMAELLQIDKNAEQWNDLELVNSLALHGNDLHGNFIIGDSMALKFFHDKMIRISDGYYRNTSPYTYPASAYEALAKGEKFGSSAGGEQPKFTTLVCDKPEQQPRAVIVKFSPKLDTPVGRRWADLLRAEHIASEILQEANFGAAKTRVFELENRVFLESERFDRIGSCGRRGLVSLRSFDGAHLGLQGKGWDTCARKMHTDKWISPTDRDNMIALHCFGELIANTDMHFGNLSFFIPENQGSFTLAPVYDMLPMFFRPTESGEVIERIFEPELPKPENRPDWLRMYLHAIDYWQRITRETAISRDFKKIASKVIVSLQRIYSIADNWIQIKLRR